MYSTIVYIYIRKKILLKGWRFIIVYLMTMMTDAKKVVFILIVEWNGSKGVGGV